ncbi:MAG: DUF721 domain-containing protein [Burkholderia sp.]|nr:DUF721 domain-containing protein [Burkholderia sp.]
MSQLNKSNLPSGLPRILTAFEILKNTTEFTILHASIEQLIILKRDLNKFLPDYIVQYVEPGLIKHGILKLFTTNSTIAARLWQIKPSLLDNLQRNDWPVISIKINVRPKISSKSQRLKEAKITSFGISVLQELTYSIKLSPLQSALANMVANHKK